MTSDELDRIKGDDRKAAVANWEAGLGGLDRLGKLVAGGEAFQLLAGAIQIATSPALATCCRC
jgi:hypothetical protein